MTKGAGVWKTALLWGTVLTLVLSFGAFVGERFSGTCMFILMPYFASLAVVMPFLRAPRFGVGAATYLPYAVLGFIPLFIFDYLQSHALKGLWAVVVWSLTGPLIGLCADAAFHVGRRLRGIARAVLVGGVVQAATFVVMLVGLTALNVNPAAADSHLRLFDTSWYFTAPWMIVNGAFGGLSAYLLTALRQSGKASRLSSPSPVASSSSRSSQGQRRAAPLR
jgi:hypothetical protein